MVRRMLMIRCIPLVLVLIACGAATSDVPTTHAEEHAATSVRYYEGTSTTTSPDGATPYGPPVAVLVRRQVDPAAQRIEEHVINEGRAFPTTLRQTQGEEFSASDEGETFHGTVTFSGPDWAWTSWTYDLTMSDGSGTLRGSGTLSAEGIDTEKMFHGPDGSAQALIVEHLRPIDEATYERMLSEATPSE